MKLKKTIITLSIICSLNLNCTLEKNRSSSEATREPSTPENHSAKFHLADQRSLGSLGLSHHVSRHRVQKFAGSPASFTVKLAGEPSSDVTVTVESGDTGEVTVSPGTLTFTTDCGPQPTTVGASSFSRPGLLARWMP